jgi:hypothetical protein
MDSFGREDLPWVSVVLGLAGEENNKEVPYTLKA